MGNRFTQSYKFKQITSRYWSTVIYLAGVFMSCLIAVISFKSEIDASLTDFTLKSDKMTDEISNRFKYYQFGLNGAASLWAVRDSNLKREEFYNYALSRDFFKEFKGTRGWGFIEAISVKDIEKFNKEAPDDFEVNKSASDDIAVIKYAEPMIAATDLLGKNLLEEYATKGTLEESRLTGATTISRQFMVSINNQMRPTYLLIYPVYKGVQKPQRFADRLKTHIGWVFATLDVGQILDGIGDIASKQIGIDIFEGRILDQLIKVYEYPTGFDYIQFNSGYKPDHYLDKTHSKIIPTTIVGQDFTIVYYSSPEFDLYHTYTKSMLIFLICLVLTHFGFYVIYSSTKTKIRAEAIALQMTEELHIQSQALADALYGAQNSEQQVRAIVDAIPGIVFWIGNDLIIRGFNNELTSMLSETSLQNITEEPYSCSELFEFYPKIHSLFQAKENQMTSELTLSFGEKQNTYLTTMRKFNDDKAIVVISIDITQQKRLEKEVENSKAKAINTARLSSLGEMAGGIAHEINNPLAIIKLKAQQLIRYLGPALNDNPQAVDAIAKISQTTDRIDKIIRGLKTIARDGEADPLVICSAEKIVSDAAELTSAKLANKGIELRISPIAPELKIMARETQIVQVLLNLINNAYDAIYHLEDKWIQVDVDRLGKNTRIKVTDSGPGIPKDIREKIMQPFFTTKELGKGTGLGLSISKGIAQAHGGELLLDESTNHTTFVLELPLVAENSDAKGGNPKAA